MYRDYKKYDEQLVRKIPFIMTYIPKQYMAMAFECGNAPTASITIFKNAASATIINPAGLTYLYCFGKNSKADLLARRLRAVLNYFDSRSIHSRIYFSAALIRSADDENNLKYNEIKEKLYDEFELLRSETRLNGYSIIECGSEEEAVTALLGSLRAKRIDLFDLTTGFDMSSFGNKLFSDSVKDKFSCFKFDSEEKRFYNCKGCGYLTYINDRSYLRVDDICALSGSAWRKSNPPEFADDYEPLWSIYSGDYKRGGNALDFKRSVMNWNYMCGMLNAYAKEHDTVSEVKIDLTKKSPVCLSYFFPDYGYETAEYLIDSLIKYGVITDRSSVYSYASDTCRAEIFSEWDISGLLGNIFSGTYLLPDYRFLKVKKQTTEKNIVKISVLYDNLSVDNLRLGADDKQTYAALKKLSDAGFIGRLIYDKDKRLVSFVYTSQRIKKMLTSAGEIMEVYTYYEAMKTGYFDDVCCGYEFKPGDTINEPDCILTKDFRSITVDCKGGKQLDRLQRSDGFGINHKRVIIADPCISDVTEDPINKIQKQRGTADIITVSDPDDIVDIGCTLRKIMEDKI